MINQGQDAKKSQFDRVKHCVKGLCSPKHFYRYSSFAIPTVGILFMLTFALGLYGGLVLAPPDYQQGEAFRMIYVHVPAAFLSLFVYTLIFVNSVVFLIWRVKLADVLAAVSAPLGASFTFLALFSGALWGKPMWGTFWVWDARLTSELILLFLYFGYLGLRSAIPSLEARGKISALFAIIGMIDVPIVHFSVNWWQTLHQGATISKFARPSMTTEMLVPLLLMISSFFLFYLFILFVKARTEILYREQNTQWVKNEFFKLLKKDVVKYG